MGDLIGAILGLILRLLMAIVSTIWSVITYIFSLVLKAIGNKAEQNKVKKLQLLLLEIEEKQRENAFIKHHAMEVLNVIDTNSKECREVTQLINYCSETETLLHDDYEILKRDLNTLSSDSLKMVINKSQSIIEHLSSIHYPIENSHLEEIERHSASGGRFIDSLLTFANVKGVSKSGEHIWTYSTTKSFCKLEFDESKQLIRITATPLNKVKFEDNPRHPWQYSEPDTMAYFNREHELEFQITRKISEIDHYDVNEIFVYMQRLLTKKELNHYARKQVLSIREAEDLDCNVFPELTNNRFIPTAPPPAEFMPDSEKMYGGKQRWAQLLDVERAGMLQAEGFLIGKIGYGSYLYTGRYDSHILTIASVGSGKGTGVVIPNLLRHVGSAVVLDPKGENLITTAHKRSLMGNKVYYFDPWDVISYYDTKYRRNVVPEAIKAHINPFDFLIPYAPNLGDNARMLASAMILRTDPNGDYFYNGAESFITKLIVYICTFYPIGDKHRNLILLRELITMPPKELLRNVLEPNYNKLIAKGQTPHQLFTELLSWLKTNIESKAKSFNDIYSFAIQGTEYITSPQVAEALKDSNIDILKLKTSPMSLYLILDMDKLLFVSEMYKPLVRVIITTCMFGASTKENATHKLLFMLDEIAQLGNLQYLPNLMSIYRSKGVVVWTIWQNLEQMQKNYEKDWQSMIGNCDVQQYFGVNDQATAELVSKAAGNTTIYKEAYATTSGETRGETIAKTFSDQTGWSKGSSAGTNRSHTYQGFNFSMTEGDSKSTNDSISGGSSYAFSRSIQISTSQTKGTTLTKESVPLITPYEVMSGGAYGVQFVFYRSKCVFPILSGKIKYYQDLEFFGEASENLTRYC